MGSWVMWACGLVAIGAAVVGCYFIFRGQGRADGHAAENPTPTTPTEVTVEVVRPQKGGMDRTTVQPGTVQAYQSAQIFSEVTGYLKTQDVDIGSRVTRGQTLAVIDVPELEKTVQRNKAAHDQALARVEQMEAQVKVAQAELEAAKAVEVQARAAAKSAESWARFRRLQKDRMKALFKETAIEERLYDEAKERLEAAEETVRSSQAAIDTSLAQKMAKSAHIEKALADVKAAEAEAAVASSEWEKSRVLVQFATIPSPYTGIITQRSLFPGDLVRAATSGGTHLPLLTVERTDRMRVIVQIPDRDVPYVDPEDEAFVELDALPNEKPIKAKISRIAGSEDPQTRLMRVEIDLPNPTGKIRQGMYGRVTIILEKNASVLSVPSSALSKTVDGKDAVYVFRSGAVRLTPVQLGSDNGVRAIVLRGLQEEDQVVANPGSGLRDGAEVTAVPVEDQAKTENSGH
jgi:RND family efflux transporter MFP subunit